MILDSGESMDLRYLNFCFADPFFYDSFQSAAPDSSTWPHVDLPEPGGWYRTVENSWVFLAPEDARIPDQGWKVHVSVRVADAARALAVTWEYCVARRLAFKFLGSRDVLVTRNLKYADRGGSGKFITIYPPDETTLEQVLIDLNVALSGLTGPYILSDLRWEAGPLYVRYGGFIRQECRDEHDRYVLALRDPDGRLVPDHRPPFFRVPEWVSLPEFLVPQQAALGDGRPPAGFRYRFTSALHFSNGGGVYLADEITGETTDGVQVVIKEARPHAGLDNRGQDAVARLARERDILESLADVDGVVDVLDSFRLGEHHFLVLRHVNGQALPDLLQKHPLIHPDSSQDAVAAYTDWAVAVLDGVRDVIASVHEHGVTFGDLHPNNVLVDDEDRVTLIDFEMAYRNGDPPLTGVGAPGFAAPDGRTGPAADRYALACLRLWMFLPLIPLTTLDPGKMRHLVTEVVTRFPVPPDYAATVYRELGLSEQVGQAPALTADVFSGDASQESLSRSLVAAIVSSASPQRTDRLFPGDIEQFRLNGLGFAHGAAGVLYALSRAGHRRCADYEEWLLRAVRAGGSRDRVGFYDGLHGISHVLDQLGRTDTAMELLHQAIRTPDDDLPANLFSGLAGVGLNLLHFGVTYSDPVWTERAVHIARTLEKRLRDKPSASLTDLGQASAATGRGGLLHGDSGIALFFLRMFDHTQDERYLDLVASALAQDLRLCVRVDDDHTVQLDEGWRLMPYLGAGSAGVGLVLREYLRHRPDEHLFRVFDGIRLAASTEFVVGSGLFAGRAGLIAFLSLCRADAGAEAAVVRHLRRLSWHALSYKGNLAFPGEQLLRLSMDLGTGTAGVLLTLHAARHNEPLLPFFPAPTTDVTKRKERHDDAVCPQPAGDGDDAERGRGVREHHDVGL